MSQAEIWMGVSILFSVAYIVYRMLEELDDEEK